MPEGERGDDREDIKRGLNDIETTRERMIGESAGTEEERYERYEPDINGPNQASQACTCVCVCVCVRGGVVSSGAVQLYPGVQQQR